MFYFGYLAWSWPSSYLSVRLPLGKYLGVSVIIWGAILMCHGATKNYAGLVTARFFLGVAEGAVAPGFSLITGMFYKRREQPSRYVSIPEVASSILTQRSMGIWFAGNCIANIISGVIAYGVGKITTSSLAHWRLLFLILGGVTSAYGVLLFLLLPDSPAKARFLNKDERIIAVQRTLENKTGVMDEQNFRMAQMWEALCDPQAWLLAIYTFVVNIPNGGITSFSSLIINGFGFTTLQTLLVGMPSGAFQLVALIILCLGSTYFKNSRLAFMMGAVAISVAGMAMVYAIPNTHRWARLAGVWLTAPFAACIPISLSLITSNIGGFTKRATVSAMLFSAYCVGNIIGPQFFFASQAPSYPTGIRATLSGFCLGVFFLASLLAYYKWENKRRDRAYGEAIVTSEIEEIAEELSNKTDRQLSTFRYTL